ncbi:MAG TPA: PQQ-binding-like beta-propeller repeat protein, partial [Planctomycetota bacterium]|nr:PQQ-binding-like beta-propeller repeat protein [Planctomycetota bacterium]
MIVRAALVLLLAGPATAQDWSTHRGGPARAGSVDGRPGPSAPKVLWTFRSKEQFLAPLSAVDARLLAVSLGAFNTGSVRAMEAADGRVAWGRGAPDVKLPTVGTPAAAAGTMYFGEGMHQTNGSSLHALRVSDGRTLWRLDVPGELVHIEASPTVADGRVFVGAGSGGVLCVDASRLTLEGRAVSAGEAAAVLDAKWKAMVDAYEVDKKKDPDFAIPPNEAALPKPSPAIAWEKGKGAWHVDAPLLVAAGKVYAASSYLDKEKLGERALVCLNAADGAELWKTPLKYNAWGGATLAGDRLVVTCSSMRYDPKELPGARGEVLCLKLDGAVEWRREYDRAVLSTAVAAGDVVVICDTAGEVHALEAASGKPRWSRKTGAPYFGGAAVAGGAVYAVDLDGKAHALSLSDGAVRWTLDLGAEAKAPGMVYGGPIVHGGRLFVATTTLEGASA